MPECPRPCDRATGHATPSVHPRSRTQRPQTRGLRRPVRVAPRTLRLCRLELGVVWQRRPESQLPVISLFYGVFPRIFALQNGKKNTRKKTSFPSQNYAPETSLSVPDRHNLSQLSLTLNVDVQAPHDGDPRVNAPTPRHGGYALTHTPKHKKDPRVMRLRRGAARLALATAWPSSSTRK